MPRTLGDFEGKTVVVGIGRFGPYIRHDGKYVSLPKEFTPQGVSLEDAIMLIQQKREQESQRLIKKFDEDDELELLNGRFGPYIAYKKKNYKLPKGSEPASLTFADCMKIVEDADKACQKETGPEKDDEIKEIQWNIAGYARKLNTFGHTFLCIRYFPMILLWRFEG